MEFCSNKKKNSMESMLTTGYGRVVGNLVSIRFSYIRFLAPIVGTKHTVNSPVLKRPGEPGRPDHFVRADWAGFWSLKRLPKDSCFRNSTKIKAFLNKILLQA